MKDVEKDTLDEELLNKTLAELSLKDFLSIINHDDLRKALLERKREYEEEIKKLEDVRKSSVAIFKDIDDLQHATTPFRVRNKEELKGVIESFNNVLELGGGSHLLIAFAVTDEKGSVRAVPATGAKPSA